MCGSLAAQQQARKPTALASDMQAPSDLKPVYQQWLDESAAYIITVEEKRAFLSLKTDAEREQFIGSFWIRRDPKPETAENEGREQHYARIAHANEHFTFNGLAGWRSDRGRIYIMYGKPDEVEKTSFGEAWIYKPLPATGSKLRIEFVDVTGTGDLRLRQSVL
jgi:GWxTD domain-containing protein